MDNQIRHTLPKKERLCGKTGISKLLADGRHGNIPGFRFCYLIKNGLEHNRIMVSVPKKFFKRAVKRNLLKRRIRESWRRLKHSLSTEKHIDVLIIYSTKEVLSYQEIYDCIGKVIERLNGTQKSNEKSE